MQNNQVEPMAFNYGGGMDYDWDSMRNPNAQAQADMYNNMADEYENQAMNSTQQAGQNLFDIGKQFMNNRNAINAQTEAAKNFAASTMTGAEAARDLIQVTYLKNQHLCFSLMRVLLQLQQQRLIHMLV
jgi:hypothetical protein